MEPFISRCDPVIAEIARYVCESEITSEVALSTARLALADSIGCAMLAHRVPECARLLGPSTPGVTATPGARVPGLTEALDPITAAFDTGMLIRWLDYNDTWLAAEWGHPSDNLGAILPLADFIARGGRIRRAGAAAEAGSDQPAGAAAEAGGEPAEDGATTWRARRSGQCARPTVGDILQAMIKAYEIQGVLALETSLNRVGHDHVLFVKVASAAVAAWMLGGTVDEVAAAASNAFVDTGPLRTYRHFPNTGSRKSWAAGDAAARGVQLALLVLAGEPGYASALTEQTWGFSDAVMGGKEITLPRRLDAYVMENILFKVSFPAEFHGQTAVEAAIALHPQLVGRLEQISRVEITTQESGKRIIDKQGALSSPADRDHCIQYMTVYALIHGSITADSYRDEAAADPLIDVLRERTQVSEEPRYSRDYLDPDRRSIANAVQVHFTDGSATDRVEVEYPIGHRRRRDEARPLLRAKLAENLTSFYGSRRAEELTARLFDPAIDDLPADELLDQLGAE